MPVLVYPFSNSFNINRIQIKTKKLRYVMTGKTCNISQKSESKPARTVSPKSDNMHKSSFTSQYDYIIHFQRTSGNRAVGQLLRSGVIQAKLQMGKSHDKYEQEADQAADYVMRMPEPQANQLEDEEDMLQPKSNAGQMTPYVHRQYEEEIAQPKKEPQPNIGKDEGPIRASSESNVAPQSQYEDGDSVPSVEEGAERRLDSSKGSGRRLSAVVRKTMEQRFGIDFSQVKVHTGTDAVQMNKALNSQAFTYGNNIFFNQGKYNTSSREGKSLLAHELTHTIHQNTVVRPLIQRRIIFRNFRTQVQHTWLSRHMPWLFNPRTTRVESLRVWSDSEVRAYTGGIGTGIHEFDDIIAGTSTEYELVGGRGQRGRNYRRELIRSVVQDMHDSSDDLFYDAYGALVSEVRRRALLSLRMRISQGFSQAFRPTGYPPHCATDPGPRVGELARSHWIVRRTPHADYPYNFLLNPTGFTNPYEALRRMLFIHRTDPCLRTLMHCDIIITALQLFTLADTMGIDIFNQAVRAGEIEGFQSESGENGVLTWNGFVRLTGSPTATDYRSLRVMYLRSEDDFIIGDHVIFWNHEAYNDLNQVQGQSWRLENAIVIDNAGTAGQRRFQGHGFVSPHTREHFINQMVGKINTLVNIALGDVGRNSVSGLRSHFEFMRNGITFNPIVYELQNGRIRNARIQYHQNGLWENSDMGNPVITMPLRRFSASDFPHPFIRPGETQIMVRRPIESVRSAL